MWYADPPFRVHCLASRTMELEGDDEYNYNGSKNLNVSITYLDDGKFLVEVLYISAFT